MNFGYSDEIYLPIPITPVDTLSTPQTLSLQADVDWLVCKVDCIPESAVLNLSLIPTAPSPASPQLTSATETASSAQWEPYTEQRLNELKAARTPVFVNFSASWCITCLVNGKVALSQPEVISAFEQYGVTYLKADWTNRGGAIAQTLESFGRNGVPLYVAYSAIAPSEPIVLPQVLTPNLVINTLEQLSEKS